MLSDISGFDSSLDASLWKVINLYLLNYLRHIAFTDMNETYM